MKSINQIVLEQASDKQGGIKLVKAAHKLDLEQYFGLRDWVLDTVPLRAVLGKNIKSSIREYEKEYKENFDSNIEIGNYVLLNEFSSMQEKYKDNYKINNNSIYYVALLFNENNKDNKRYYLAIPVEILEGKQKYESSIKTIKEHIEPIKESIISIGHKDYFSQELYDLLIDLYKKKKISNPADWFSEIK